jgi:hypothetical protein
LIVTSIVSSKISSPLLNHQNSVFEAASTKVLDWKSNLRAAGFLVVCGFCGDRKVKASIFDFGNSQKQRFYRAFSQHFGIEKKSILF